MCIGTIKTPRNFLLLTRFISNYLRGEFGLLSNNVCTSHLEMLGQNPMVSLKNVMHLKTKYPVWTQELLLYQTIWTALISPSGGEAAHCKMKTV